MLKTQREQLGALQLGSDELRWRVGADLDVQILEPEDAPVAHSLIEELMILANIMVARRLVASFPAAAVIRQHPAPLRAFKYADAFKALGLTKLDLTNGNTLLTTLKQASSQWLKKFDPGNGPLNKE